MHLPVDIESLPDEILGTIFRAAVPYPDLRTPLSPIPLGQIALSHVSQHWRAVVLDDPFLWNSILFSTRRRYNVELCQLFLERSQQAPLDIQAKVSQALEEQSFTSLFLPHIHRWGNVILMCESSELVTCLSSWSAVPLLETLELRITGSPSDHESVNIPFLQGGAPRLRQLKCSSLRLDGHPHDFPCLQELFLGPYNIPYSNGLSGEPFHSTTGLVAPHLTRLVARKFAIGSPFRPPAPVQFDNLLQLELEVETLTLWEFMEHCRLPKLNSVAIRLLLRTESFVFGGNPTPLPTVRNVLISFDISPSSHLHNDVAALTIRKLTQLFPDAVTLKAHPLTALEEVILDGAVVGWPKLTSINANTVSLDVVKRIVFDRRNHGYFTPLKEFNLQTIQGGYPMEDYIFVSQNVDFRVQMTKKPNASGWLEIGSLTRFSATHLGGRGQL